MGAPAPKTQLVIAVTSCEANGVKAFSEYEVSKILLTLTQGKNRGGESVTDKMKKFKGTVLITFKRSQVYLI